VHTFVSAFDVALGLLRLVVFAAGAATAALAALSTAVRARRLSPFGSPARFVRERVDPLFAPMERRLVRAGGSPAHAPWWSVAAVVVGGLVLLALLGFLRDQIVGLSFAARGGPRAIAALIVSVTFAVLRFAVLVRVLGSWLQQGRWSPWTRWAYALTDWFMQPLARVVPTLGALDISPIVAYFGLGLLQAAVLSMFR
jgi:YggT family protein